MHPRPSFARAPRLRPAGWLVVCVAAIAAVVGSLVRQDGTATGVWDALAERPFEGRLASMPWRSSRRPQRGDQSAQAVSWRALAAAGRAQEDAAVRPSFQALQRLGGAALAVGQVAVAVQALEDAVVADPDSAAGHADLAAAYLARGAAPANALDLARALEAAERARRLNPRLPAALFNRALALERLHLPSQAAQAWQAVVDQEPAASGWSDEARRHQQSLARESLPADAAADDLRAIQRWADAAAVASAVPLPIVTGADGLFPALRDLAAATPEAERRPLAVDVRRLIDAEAALSTPDYGRAGRLATEVASHGWPADAPLQLWAERIRLTVGFNTGRGVDLGPRAEQLAATATRLGFRNLAADARHRLAGVDFVAGRYEQALTGFDAAMSLRRAIGNRRGEVSSRLALGDSLRMLGREPEAWQQYLVSLAVGPIGDAVLEHARFVNPANDSLAANMAETALAFSREAVRQAETVDHPGLLTTALYFEARALVRLGATEDARETMRRCRQVFARLTDASIRDRYLADITHAEAEVFASTNPAESIRLARESQARFADLRTQHQLLALLTTEARAHRALGDVDAARAALHRGVGLMDAQQAEIAGVDNLPSFVDASWDVFAELVDLEATAGRPDAALDALDRGYDVRRRWRAQAPVSLAEASRRGPVVAYLSRADALWIWVVREGRVVQRRVAVPRAELVRHVARLTHVLALDVAPDALDEAAGVVAHDVWWPVADAVGGEGEARVAMVLDPVLQRIPFSLLPWSPGVSTRLVDRVAVVLCPSVSACGDSDVPGPPTRVSALHAGQGGAGLAALPEARAEAERIGRRYDGASVEVASVRSVTDALSASELMHFSGHAVADERYPGRSQLLLAADDGSAQPVPLRRLLGGTVRTRLVVLSACRTSRAEARRGEGGAGVAGEFLRAGVAQVIASQWDVRDDLTADAMSAVHEALASGAASWDAVRMAQQRMRTGGASPRDWAGYVVYTSRARR